MSSFSVARNPAEFRQPSNRHETRWFTTWDAGRALHLTPEGVRHLVRQGKLTCEWTPSRRRLFLAHQVLDLVAKRAKARLVLVASGHHKGARSTEAPQQMSLFRVRLQIVAGAKEALDVRQAKVR